MNDGTFNPLQLVLLRDSHYELTAAQFNGITLIAGARIHTPFGEGEPHSDPKRFIGAIAEPREDGLFAIYDAETHTGPMALVKLAGAVG